MQYAHKQYDVTDFHGALLDILSVMNQPKRDETLLAAADVKLDQVLFPLLVTIGRYGPVGVVELADSLGRDYTTVSRQVKKLQEQGLALKQPAERDKRISEVTLSEQGKALTNAIDGARQKLMNAIFAEWPEEDVKALFRLVRQYAESVKGKTPSDC
ncbi:MarR family transcriptional regulator [Enterobacter asburiae]|uniref:MarR family winged helix-turn-helix transcriptional regulator n=1 Tax=unclassified Scandinavium TaxID=2830652 RepID=UPI00289B1F5A|nr:MarR family transcriptional regulator [Scandinavium sp.]